jgi:hypothetical protein
LERYVSCAILKAYFDALTVTDSQREVLLAPSTTDGVNVTTADTAALNLDVDVVVAKGLRVELILMEIEPSVRAIDLEAGELLWVRHFAQLKPGLVIGIITIYTSRTS